MRKKLLWISLITVLILGALNLNTMGVTATTIHDIAVASVTPSPTSVRLSDPVNITVVVENQGNFTETFNVTIYINMTAIETKSVTNLENGTSTTLTFTWDTTGVMAGTYTINATASTVPGETDTEDNTLVSPSKVKVISPYIAVIPQSTVDPNLTIGMTYTVSIYTDYNGSDVWGYQFSLSYNPSVLNGSEVTNGDLIVGETAIFTPGTFDNTAGELSLTGAFFYFSPGEPAPLTSGPGTLANVTFTVVGTGDSDITLIGVVTRPETRLMGYTEGGYGEEYYIIDWSTDLNPKPDSGHILHGYFRNTAEAVTHDIAVISVTPYPTSVVAGELVNITVVVKNTGTVNEDVNVKVYRGTKLVPILSESWRIGTKTVSNLAAGANTTLTFTWNTTGIMAKTYTIIAKAEPVAGETYTADNTLESDKTVTVERLPEEPRPIGLIIGIVVVVVVVGAVAVYVIRRRKKPTSE